MKVLLKHMQKQSMMYRKVEQAMGFAVNKVIWLSILRSIMTKQEAMERFSSAM